MCTELFIFVVIVINNKGQGRRETENQATLKTVVSIHCAVLTALLLPNFTSITSNSLDTGLLLFLCIPLCLTMIGLLLHAQQK